MTRSGIAAWVALAAFASACGGSAPAQPNYVPPKVTTEVAASSVEPLPASSLRRSDVHTAVVAGVGAFLQHVDVDVNHPVMRGGKFYGYRILKFKGDPGFWDGVDLGPGDIVTHVNGFGVGSPDEAHDALQSLDVSSELKVEFERAGKLRELRYAIIDDVGPNSAPPPR